MAYDKKSSIVQILEILKKHSDKNHRLSREDILNYLRKEYKQNVDPRTVTNNINSLLAENKDINFKEIYAKVKGEKIPKRKDYYLNRKFDESELRLIIDSVLCSKNINEKQCQEIIKKLLDEASEHFGYKKRFVNKLTSGLKGNKDLFLNIEVIGEAIDKQLKITYNYFDFDINKEYVSRKDNNGNDKIYTLTPIQLVVNNGRYYLFGLPDIDDNLWIYRVDKMMNTQLTDIPARKKSEIKNFKDDFSIGKHIAEHIFMNIGPSEFITFEFDSYWISSIIDWFGKDIILTMKNNKTCEGRIKVNVQSFENWAMMCSYTGVKVIEPKYVVDDIKQRIKNIAKLYK